MKSPGIRYAMKAGVTTVGFLWLLGMLVAVLQLVLPSQVGRLTDMFQREAVQPPTWTEINAALVRLFGAQLMITWLIYWQRAGFAQFQQRIAQSLAVDLFSRLLRFSAEFFREHRAESINTRTLEDSRTAATFWSDALVNIPLAAISMIVLGSYMLYTNWLLGACLIPLCLLSGYFLFFDRWIQQVNQQSREVWDELRVRSHEVISGVSEIRNHGAFDHALKILEKPLQDFGELRVRAGKWNALFRAGGPLIATLQTGTLYWLGAGLCLSGSSLAGLAGEISWGDVIAFLLIAGLFREPAQTIAVFLLDWRMTRENCRRVEEFLERPLVFVNAPDAPAIDEGETSIVFERVDVMAKTGVRILNTLDAAIEPARHVGLVGPAGCGKSTAMQLLVREVTPSNGRLLVGGRSVLDYDTQSLFGRIGLVPQTTVLFDTTIRENLLLGLRRRGAVCLEDEAGSLDVTHLSGVASGIDLDRRLVEVLRMVDFDKDVLSKALDRPLPAERRFDPLRERIRELRTVVTSSINGLTAGLMAPFDRGHLLVPGSIRENIFGPGLRGESAAEEETELLLGAVQGMPVLTTLLTVGYLRYVSDHSLAVWLAEKAPGLAKLVAASKRLPGSADQLEQVGRGEVENLPRKSRRRLLEIALDTDVETANRLLHGEDLERLVLQARRQGTKYGSRRDGGDRWPSPDSPYYAPDLTLRENLLAGRVDSRVYRAAESVDSVLWEALSCAGVLDEVLLAGLEYAVGENGRLLSGGQRQKVALGRILMKNPSILLLDEATANLDEISQARVIEMLQREFQGKTVVSISHRLSTIARCDEILVLDRGQLVQRGRPAQLASEDGLFAQLASQERFSIPSDESRMGVPRAATVAAAEQPIVAVSPEDELRRAISMSELFGHLDGPQLVALERTSSVCRCPAGTVLFRRGDPGDELYLICQGQVDFLGPSGGGAPVEDAEIVQSFGPGQVFGELSLLGEVPRTLGARAGTDVQLLAISRTKLLELIHADPDIALALLKTLACRIAAMRDDLYGRVGVVNR